MHVALLAEIPNVFCMSGMHFYLHKEAIAISVSGCGSLLTPENLFQGVFQPYRGLQAGWEGTAGRRRWQSCTYSMHGTWNTSLPSQYMSFANFPSQMLCSLRNNKKVPKNLGLVCMH